MNASVMTPQGHGVRQPAGALPGEPSCARAAGDRRTPRRCRTTPSGGLLTVTSPLWVKGRDHTPPRPSRLCGCLCGLLTLLLWCVAFTREVVAQFPTTNTAVHFHPVEVFVDSKEQPLAAYQIEFAVTNGSAKIVGIEGGAHAAFAQPPFYDPKAMQHERVIIAAFSMEPADKLPKGKIRVATIHLQTEGAAELKPALHLQTAARPDGSKLEAEVTSEERNPK